jgi:hypothetical protein
MIKVTDMLRVVDLITSIFISMPWYYAILKSSAEVWTEGSSCRHTHHMAREQGTYAHWTSSPTLPHYDVGQALYNVMDTDVSLRSQPTACLP